MSGEELHASKNRSTASKATYLPHSLNMCRLVERCDGSLCGNLLCPLTSPIPAGSLRLEDSCNLRGLVQPEASSRSLACGAPWHCSGLSQTPNVRRSLMYNDRLRITVMQALLFRNSDVC